ncbi:hypothetical protein EBM89_19880 [Cellulomonas triticagri]|uniref:Uncharacterized protein n=1 Tax=Cellulomonas triticagri TaxID=2483352 RepID=A0A3M2IUF3_9CELL|nr:hypothetical protein EBM89_19880 [Cellulomonas triticagri]
MRVIPAAVDDATEVRVVRGQGYDPRHRHAVPVLHVERDRERVQAIIRAMDVLAPWQPSAWMQEPEQSLVFLSGRDLRLEVGLIGGLWLRVPDLEELRIADPASLASLLRPSPDRG